MLALQVEVDDELFTLAGAEDWGLLSMHISANRGDPNAPAESARTDHIELSVGGLAEANSASISEHIRWGRRELQLGSKVTLRVVETSSPSVPIKRYRSDREVQEQPLTEEEIHQMRWNSYLELKKEFEGDGAA